MNDQTDTQLLREYAESRSEAAFAELVRRHVDFVYSAARRMVCDPHLAEDVTQGVFVALAKSAAQLTEHQVLSGWLHRTARNIAAQTVRTDARRRAREQEAYAMNQLLATEPDAHWEDIAPHLDEVLDELAEPDRDALLLRYFESKSAHEMAQILSLSDEAAQKRVSRAVEKLRELLSKRGVTVGAGGLVIVISANAVQAAPSGLVAAISTAVSITSVTAAQTATAITATKAIVMTTLQKTLIATTIAIAAGTGIYEAGQASHFRSQAEASQRQQASLGDQIQQLQHERDDTMKRTEGLLAENRLLKSNSNQAELLKLRAEATQARKLREELAKRGGNQPDPNDPMIQHMLEMKAQAEKIAQFLELMPDKKIPELKLLTEVDWLTAAKAAKFDSDESVRETLSKLRSLAKNRLPLGRALGNYTRNNNGQLPADMSQLKPAFTSALADTLPDNPVDEATVDAILNRYALLRTGNLSDVPTNSWIIAEKAPVDRDYDSRAKFGAFTSTTIGTGLHSAVAPEDQSY